jgi:malonyl-CoA decarboxylase
MGVPASSSCGMASFNREEMSGFSEVTPRMGCMGDADPSWLLGRAPRPRGRGARDGRASWPSRPSPTWWEHVGAIAQRGRQVLRHSLGGRRAQTLGQLCRRLLVQRGEASALALATDLVGTVSRLDTDGLDRFLELLARDFSADPGAVDAAIDAWRDRHGDPDALLRLSSAVEPPRQELFRRMNMAAGGTAAILRLRERLLELLPERPDLRPVDADLRHLLSSWFNRGFLQLQLIDWQTPAVLLEKLIRYEAVHQIRGWDDLRRRLADDRRCFAFFHPALPGEPLIFVEVALTRDLPDAIAPLIDPGWPIADPLAADTAVFFSISNCQAGLRGISFGNFLIKQVVADLGAELPGLKRFATLSPMPLFAATVRRRDLPGGFTEARLRALAGDADDDLRQRTGIDDVVAALEYALARPELQEGVIASAVQRVALAYLVEVRHPDGRVLDPVAHFHLANGARLERIDVRADRSPGGLGQSHGVMVNYVYERERVELNHERYVDGGVVTTARSLAGELARVQDAWRRAVSPEAPAPGGELKRRRRRRRGARAVRSG